MAEQVMKSRTRRHGDAETGRGMFVSRLRPRVPASACRRVISCQASAVFLVFALSFSIYFGANSAGAQTTPRRNGAHSARARETFNAADRRLVERAIGATCAERARDPSGSMPIDAMQSRPSLAVSHPDAVAGLRRAERLLPTTRQLVVATIIKLAREYDLYGSGVTRGRIRAANARVEAVRRVKPDVDARDNASVLLREPRTIEFGTIFLAGLPSDEAMISVLAHELTHIASGQADSLRLLFRAIARRASARTGLRIQGQRAEELACDLVGAIAAREFIRQTPSWEPLPRRVARAFEHNCVDDDESDEDHLSPRNTIRALFALDTRLASEVLADGPLSGLLMRRPDGGTRILRVIHGRPARATVLTASTGPS
jgi:hypothetical protein